MSLTQVLEELEKHFRHAGQNPSSLYTSIPPLLSAAQPPSMATAAEARQQLCPASGSGGSASKLHRFSASSSLPLPKTAAKKRTRTESSNAALEAAINSLRSDTTPSTSAFSDSQTLPAGPFLPMGLTANVPIAAFGTPAMRLALLAGAGAQGTPLTGLAFGNLATCFGSGPAAVSSAAGASSGAALELNLLLTTLQSLAQLPEEPGQPINLIASSSQVAEAQLRDWLRQMQQHAPNAPGEMVSIA